MTGEAAFIEGRVIQEGQPVASVSGMPSDVRRELLHYAAVYRQDGPVRLELKRGRRWAEWQP